MPQRLAGIRMEPPPSPPVDRGQRKAAAAAGAAGGVVGVPGVAAVVTEAVFAHADEGEFRGVGLAEDDGAGVLDAFDDGGVFFRDAVFEEEGAGGGGDAPGHLGVFDGDGQAVESAQLVAAHDGILGGLCVGEGLVVGDEEEGVKLGIDSFDPVEEELGELYGGDLPGGDQLEEVGGGGVGEFLVRHGVAVPWKRWGFAVIRGAFGGRLWRRKRR
jgi:hypothetical protein